MRPWPRVRTAGHAGRGGVPDPRDGKYRWRPTVFVATVPYERATYLLDVAGPEAVTRFEALAEPSVEDFLDLLAASRGLKYTHAWWDTYPGRRGSAAASC